MAKIYDVKKMRSHAIIGVKSATPVKEGGHIVDYLDVVISGYASTNETVTKSDRYGDYLLAGAFAETIPKYLKNAIVLQNHENCTDDAVAACEVIREDERGLYVEDRLSNAPGLRDLRFKVAEGILKALSIGGFFYYLDDGRGIYKVDLFEHSLVAIPANPDALFSVRSLDVSDLEKLFEFATSRNQLENIVEIIKAGRIMEQKQTDLALKFLAEKQGLKTAQEIRRGLSVGGIKIL